MRTPFALVLTLTIAAGVNGCASGPARTVDAAPAMLEATTCGSVARVHRLGDFLFAAQPAREDFVLLRDAGVRTVINFRHRSELPPDFDERAEVERLGMTYVHLPWSGEAQLTDEVFDRGREALRTAEPPVFVHCASANRVGPIYLAWRVLDGGVHFDQALDEATRIGMRTPAFEKRARTYVGERSK